MKKVFVFSIIFVSFLALSCTNEKLEKGVRDELISDVIAEYDVSGIHFFYTKGAPFKTKGSDADFITVTASDESNSFQLVMDGVEVAPGVINSSHYDNTGTKLAELTIVDDTLIDIEVIVDDVDINGRKDGEKYMQCVRRTYQEQEEMWDQTAPILHDFPVIDWAFYGAETAWAFLSCIGKDK